MKSLLAVLAVTSALGIGYWKYKNPNGGMEDAKVQASQMVERLKAGMETVKNPNASSSASGISANAGNQSGAVATETTAQVAAIAAESEQLQSSLADTSERLSALESSINDNASNGVGNEVLALQSKVADLETAVTALMQSPPDQQPGDSSGAALNAQASSELAALVAVTAELESQSADYANQLDTLAAQVAELSTDASGADSSDDISQVTADITTRIDSLESDLGTMTSRLDVLDNRLGTLVSAASSTGAATDASDGTASVQLDAATVQFDQRMASLEEQLASMASKVAANEDLNTKQTGEASAEAESRIAALEAQLADMAANASRGDTLKTELTAATARIAELEAKLDEQLQSERLQSVSVQTLQNELQNQLQALTEDVNAAADRADLASVSTTLNRSRARIETLEQRVDQLPDSIAADNARELQKALQSQIAELEAQLAESASKPDEELVTTLSTVQEKITALEQQQFVTAEDLQELSKERSIQYKVYFDKGRDTITPAAAKVLDSFIKQESNRATGISIFGTTDRVGSSAFNQQLALRRANSVRSYIIQRGFEFNKIQVVDGIGEDLAAAELADGKEDPNQRSVILFAFQP